MVSLNVILMKQKDLSSSQIDIMKVCHPIIPKLIHYFPTLIPPHLLVCLVLVVPKRLPSRLAILHIVRGIRGFKFTVVHALYPKGFSALSSLFPHHVILGIITPIRMPYDRSQQTTLLAYIAAQAAQAAQSTEVTVCDFVAHIIILVASISCQ